MLKKVLVSLSLILALPALVVGQEKKTAASSKGVINVFPDCSQVPGNLMRNCGFETGNFEGWLQSGDTSSSTVTMGAAHSGNFGAQMGPTGFLGFLTQSVATIPGQLYEVSFWMRSAGQPNQFMLFWNGTPISNCVGFPTTATPMADGSPQFDQFFFSSLPPAGGDNTVITFGFFNPPDFFFFDDVVVVPSSSGAQAN